MDLNSSSLNPLSQTLSSEATFQTSNQEGESPKTSTDIKSQILAKVILNSEEKNVSENSSIVDRVNVVTPQIKISSMDIETLTKQFQNIREGSAAPFILDFLERKLQIADNFDAPSTQSTTLKNQIFATQNDEGNFQLYLQEDQLDQLLQNPAPILDDSGNPVKYEVIVISATAYEELHAAVLQYVQTFAVKMNQPHMETEDNKLGIESRPIEQKPVTNRRNFANDPLTRHMRVDDESEQASFLPAFSSQKAAKHAVQSTLVAQHVLETRREAKENEEQLHTEQIRRKEMKQDRAEEEDISKA